MQKHLNYINSFIYAFLEEDRLFVDITYTRMLDELPSEKTREVLELMGLIQ